MPKEGKKEKDNKGKEKRKYFYKSDDRFSSIKNNNKKKTNTQIKIKKETDILEKSKKDVEGLLMYKKQPIKKEGITKDPAVVMVQS
eukprot:15366263-Ditylum_brightwellii.AAC.1